MTGLLDTPDAFRIRALLERGGWRTDDALIARALPHFITDLSPADTISALSNLGISMTQGQARLSRVSRTDCPALFIAGSGEMTGIIDRDGGRLFVQKQGESFPRWVDAPDENGLLVRIGRAEDADGAAAIATASLGEHLTSHWRSLAGLFLVSLMTSLLAFAPPLFVMAVYDRVIPASSPGFLAAIVLGIILVLGTDILLRILRSRALAHLGGSVDRHMGRHLFRKLMGLPLDQLLKTGVNQQLGRLKQFESLRDAFTGQALSSFFDLPFTLIFAAAIWWISPDLGLAILGTAVAYLSAFLAYMPLQRRRNLRAAESRLALQSMQAEIVAQQRALHRSGATETWMRRARHLAIAAARDARDARAIGMQAQALGQSLMLLAGCMTIFIGAKGAIDGTLTLGALVATMALVWRVLAPIQALYAAGPQIAAHVQSFRQVERVAALPEELRHGARWSQTKSFAGTVALSGVSCRYQASGDAVLSGISVTAEAGELLAVAGPNGAGKSTLLKLIASLHLPVAGSVRLDNMDLRQIPVDDLRGAISYLPQGTEFFHGTIAQNFRLANILATEADIWAAIGEMGLEADIRALPDGIETRMTEEMRARMSQSVLRALAMARTFCRDAPVYVLDEPANGLDRSHDLGLARKLRDLKGRRTVILATRFASQLELADRILYLEDGRPVLNDRNPGALDRLRALPKASIT